MHYGGIEEKLSQLIERSVNAVFTDLNIHPAAAFETKPELEIPAKRANGDLATSIALKCAKTARMGPVEFAGLVKAKLCMPGFIAILEESVERVEVKPPGFINLFFSRDFICGVLSEIHKADAAFGSSASGRGAKVQVEFVSANPTGPLTIAHGRQAAIGDSIANILEFLGHRVVREYYLNDEGTQMNILGDSIRARYLELCGAKGDFPSDGYKGSYVMDVAAAFKARYGLEYAKGDDKDLFREFALQWILDDIKKDL